MLVRTNSILLFWSAFPAQPIKVVDNVPPSPSISNSFHELDLETAEANTPDNTAQSANTSTCNSSEYGVVTSITSTTLEVPTILLMQQQVELEEENILAPISSSPTLPPPPPIPPHVAATAEEDAIDSFSAYDAQESIKEPSIISSIADQTTSLLDNPIPTYYTRNTEEEETEEVIYYKRREDYYPPTLPTPAPTTKEPHLK